MGPVAVVSQPIRWRLVFAITGALAVTAVATREPELGTLVSSPELVGRTMPYPGLPRADSLECDRPAGAGGTTFLVLKPACDPYFQRHVAPTL